MKSIHFIAKLNYYQYFSSYLNQNKQIFYRNIVNQKLLKVEKSSVIKDITQVKFEVLNVFYNVVICGSIGLASERLSMTQPAISFCLNKIEKEFGLKLFNVSKNTKYFKLTPPGLILFNSIQRLFVILSDGISLSNSSQILVPLKNQQSLGSFLEAKGSKNFLLSNRKFLYFIKTPPVKVFKNSLKKDIEFKSLDLHFLNFQSKNFFLPKEKVFLKSKNNFANQSTSIHSESKNFHTYSTSDLQEKNYIEIQTLNAFKTCLDLDLAELSFDTL